MDDVANEADVFLQPEVGREAAREDIRDYVKSHQPELPASERVQVVNGVLAILEEEDFFRGTRRAAIWPGATDVDAT